MEYEDLDLDDLVPKEDTLSREGDDLLGLCRQIYSHTPQSLEHSFQFNKSPKGYVANLERLVDILRLYLELLLEFIGLSPKVASTFRLHRAVSVPVLSVPALAYTVWTRIKYLTTDSIRKELTTITEEAEKGRSSSETQTALLSLSTCESCHLSQSVVKELISKVEFFCSTHDISESSVLITRDQLRTKVHDITNWKAMMEWCSALATDIVQLTEITDKLLTNWKTERTKEKKRYEELENKLKILEGKGNSDNEKREGDNERKSLEEKNKLLNIKLEKREKEIQELIKKIKTYETSCNSIQEECSILKITTEIEKDKVKVLEEQVGEKMHEIKGIISKYELETTKLSKRVEELEKELQIKEITQNEQMESLEIQEQKILNFKQNELELQERLKDCNQVIASFSGIQEDRKKLQVELDNISKKEIVLKERITQLERMTNDLEEECELLKEELQRYDPTFQLTQKKGTINPSPINNA